MYLYIICILYVVIIYVISEIKKLQRMILVIFIQERQKIYIIKPTINSSVSVFDEYN